MTFTHKLFIAILTASLSIHPALAQEIVVNAVGDIMLAGSGAATFQRRGYDYAFAATADELRKGDIAVGNLEAPIALGGTEFMFKKFRFRADPLSAPALKRAGFSVLTLANNHMMDFGEPALLETLHNLDSNGILSVGAGQSLSAAREKTVLQVKGVKVAFLAYSVTLPVEFFAAADRAGTAPGYPRYCREDITQAKASADYVVVSFHWGIEGADTPHYSQVTTARSAIDAGADIVLGHHPHVLQGIERYKKGIIFYSLGNFAFGSLSPAADRSVIARITLDKGIKAVELVPLNVLNSEVRFQPKPLKGKRGKAVIEHLNLISREMGTVISADGSRYLVRIGMDSEQFVRKGEESYVQAVRGN
jgi:poly-gamma-glutamate capsule biosynthesis protein CapA/YwtB (metallophosphatase superfamily)